MTSNSVRGREIKYDLRAFTAFLACNWNGKLRWEFPSDFSLVNRDVGRPVSGFSSHEANKVPLTRFSSGELLHFTQVAVANDFKGFR